jgi:hypothetical protein
MCPTNDCSAIVDLADDATVKIQRSSRGSDWSDFDECTAKAAREALSAVKTDISYRAVSKPQCQPQTTARR